MTATQASFHINTQLPWGGMTGTTWPGTYQPPYIPNPTPPHVIPNTTPYTLPAQIVTHVVSQDHILTKARAIREMLESKAITRAEARKMLAKLDPTFAAILA